MQADSNNHAPASYQFHTGDIQAGNASLGSWLTYGLGTENANLPAFVDNLVGAMQALGFDGLDLDWEPIASADQNDRPQAVVPSATL